MADYYPLIARAVAGLEKNSGEARRALYERARTALVTQLRGVEPALSDADITRERLALEETIRKVEAEAARRPRQELSGLPPVQPVPPPMRFEKPLTFAPPPAPPPPLSPPSPPPAPEFSETPPPSDWRELQKELDRLAPPPQASTYDSETPEESVEEPSAPARRPSERRSLVDEGLKGFRDVMAETEDLGSAAASASKTARETREAFSELPPAGEVERIEPHIEPRFGPEDLKPAEHELPLPPPRRANVGGKRTRPPAPPRPAPEDFGETHDLHFRREGRGLFAKVIVLAAILLLGAAAVFAYLRWGSSLTAMLQSSPPPATQAAKETPQARPKIADRVGGQQDSRPAGGNAAAVAQRALLYEIGANPQERKQYIGSVIWRTETTSPGPGQAPDMSVKAEVEIPERQMRMSFVVKRNLDPSLPASHTVEILFSTPPDFSAGGISDVPAVLLGDTERGAGTPLTGLRVKVTNGFFLVGLSNSEDIVRRNMQLLKTRPWLHLHVVYNNGQPALLLLEKGVPGDRAFEDALNAWGQNLPPPAPEQR